MLHPLVPKLGEHNIKIVRGVEMMERVKEMERIKKMRRVKEAMKEIKET